MWHFYPLIKLYIIFFKLNVSSIFYLHKYVITLVLIKTIIFESRLDKMSVSPVQLGNYPSPLQFKPNDKKVPSIEKSVKANEIVLLLVHNYQSKQAYLSFSCLLDKISYYEASCLCWDTKLLLFDTELIHIYCTLRNFASNWTTVYTCYLHTERSGMYKIFNCSDILWKIVTEFRTIFC